MSVNITSKLKMIPGIASWTLTPLILPISEQDKSHVESLRELEREYKVKIRLDSVDIYNTKWVSDQLNQIFSASYPLGIKRENARLELGQWEAFVPVVKYFTIKQNQRANKKQNPKTSIKSFHIDDTGATIYCLQKVLNRVEFETGSQINWDWLATCSKKIEILTKKEFSFINKREKWICGVDGDNLASLANIRAWKNKITVNLKSVDLIVSASNQESNIVQIIAFCLINLNPEGIALIRIPRIATSSVAAMIHLFSNCFEYSDIKHLTADDATILYGENFLNNLSSNHYRLLYDFCETNPVNVIPFTTKYAESNTFVDTVDKLVEINNQIQSWRYEFYEKILNLNKKISSESSAKTFGGYVENLLAETFEDKSDEWILRTGF